MLRLLPLPFLLAALAACGDDMTIDSGAPEEVTTTTTSTTEPEDNGDDDDEDDDEDNGDDGPTQWSCDDDGDNPEVSQVGDEVEITGSCESVSVIGQGHAVTIESTESLAISGQDHHVTVSDFVGEISLDGLSHDLTYPDDDTPIDDESCVRCDIETT